MPSFPLRTRVLGAVVFALGCVVASLAQGFDPEEPQTVVVGAGDAVAPLERVDVRRRGRASVPLPAQPREIWRRELAGGLDVSPVVAGDGSVVAALTSPDLVRIGPDGRQAWRVGLGSAAATTSPVITSDGSAVVLTSDGTLWKVSAGGRTRWRRELGLRAAKVLAAPLPRRDGSVVVAAEQGLALVGPEGEVWSRATLAGRPIGGLVPWRGGVVVTTADGQVWHWRSPSPPRELGSFGGQLLDGGPTLTSGRVLVGVVDRSAVVALDLLGSGTTPLLTVDGTAMQLEGSVTLDHAGVLWATGLAGELIGVDAHGTVVRRGALEPIAPLGDAGAPMVMFARLDATSSPPLVAGSEGRLGFVRGSGKVGVVNASGTLAVADTRFCARPLALLPGVDRRMIVACASGSIGAFSDE